MKLTHYPLPTTHYQSGQIMILAIVFLLVVLILAAALFSRVANFLQFGSGSVLKEQAGNLAEAGVDYALWKLNEKGGSFAGESNVAVGTTGSFTVTVSGTNPSLKKITSTGYVPNTTSPRAKKTIKVNALVAGTTIAFNYAAQVGTGGLSMANSSEVQGSIYSNGDITGSGPSTIEGDAYAVGIITSPPLVRGNSFPGASPAPMPTVNYQDWKDAANPNDSDPTNDPITCSPTCEITSSATIGPRKYIGNLTIRESGTVVTMAGPIHVTGNFEIKNSSELKLGDTFGSNGSVLIVDGTITVSNNGKLTPTSANPKGYILAVTTSTSLTAITISNLGATAIFYALDGEARLANQAGVTALVAKKLTLQNQSKLIYEQGLASTQFTSGPGGAWVIKKGTYRFTTPP